MSTKQKDISYITWHMRRGISWVHARGHRWCQERFLPAINRLEANASSRRDRETLGDAWYIIGDIHDFNNAPKAAINAYRKSIRWDSENGASHRELGCMLRCIGNHRAAVRALSKSVELNPSDEMSKSDLEFATIELRDPGAPLYSTNDWAWHIRELLARRKFRVTLKELSHRRSIQAAQLRACAYAALNQKDAVLEEWRKIARAKGKIKLQYLDWYYITDVVFDEADFWETILACGNRFWHIDILSSSYGIWWNFDSLFESVFPRNTSVPWESPENRSRVEKIYTAYSQYQLARIRKDDGLANRLAKDYPNWPEAVELATQLKSRKRKGDS